MTKTAYLTIDDAPSKDFKRKINYLYSKKIPAIFFCQGNLLEKRPEEVVYAIKKGFIIGNHSYSHPYFSKLTLKQAFEQIKRTDEIIEDLYKKSGVKRPIKVFRFPYLEKGRENKKAIQRLLRRIGYKQPKFENIKGKADFLADLFPLIFHKDIDVGCSYDTFDWAVLQKGHPVKGLKEVLARMDENIPGGLNQPNSREVILMHDFDIPKSKKMFVPIIQKLIKKGLKFKSSV